MAAAVDPDLQPGQGDFRQFAKVALAISAVTSDFPLVRRVGNDGKRNNLQVFASVSSLFSQCGDQTTSSIS